MAESPGLTLESCRSQPALNMMFLEEGFLFAEFRNNSDAPIEIIKVRVQFETEPRLDPYETSVSPMITLMAHNRSQTIRIPFVTDLSLISTTNSYSLIVSYRKVGSQQILTRTYPSFGSLIIHPIPRQETRQFFVSHKDPQNTALARRVDHYLTKIGFSGYLAEDNRLPGVDLWQKIQPAIEQCIALVVLWTVEATHDPAMIKRELEYALKVGKTPILFAASDADLPDSFPKNIEFVRTQMTEADLVHLLQSIERCYRIGVYG